jgi:hypothetical protein
MSRVAEEAKDPPHPHIAGEVASPLHRHHHASTVPYEHRPFEGGWRPSVDPAGVRARGKIPRFDGRSMKDWQRVHERKLEEAAKAIAAGPAHHRHLPLVHRREVEQHADMDDMWMVINGVVYDVTVWQHYHPGGEHIMRDCAGKDVTDLYNYYHRWASCEGIIGALAVGLLASDDDHREGVDDGSGDPVEVLLGDAAAISAAQEETPLLSDDTQQVTKE